MITLRIQHRVASYEGWKKAFESDPINRKKSGVKQYRIYRPANDPNFVIIDLDFDNTREAEAAKGALQNMFPNIEGKLIFDVQLSILNMVESKAL